MATALIVALRGRARCVIRRAPLSWPHGITQDHPFSFNKCYLCSRLTLLPMFPVNSVTYVPGCSLRPDSCATAMPHPNLGGHTVGNPSEDSSRARSGWTRDAQSYSRNSAWRFQRTSEGPSRPRGGSKTARRTAPRRGPGLLLPSRSRLRPRPPTRHVSASPAPRDPLPLAWPSVRSVPSTSLVQPAREWHDAVYSRALPRPRPRHAESASSPYHVRPNLAREPHRAGIERDHARTSTVPRPLRSLEVPRSAAMSRIMTWHSSSPGG